MAKNDKDNGVTIPEVEKPLPSDGKGTGLVKRDDPYSLMDALDDKIIIAELEGRVVEKWVYHYPQEGKDVWGLSKVGVDAACREMAKQGEVIREISIDYIVDPSADGHFLFTAKAARYVINKDGAEIELDSAFGTKRQATHHPKGAVNKFWFEQGSMKALRNARQRLISEDIRAKIMALAKKGGKVENVKPDQGYNKRGTPAPPGQTNGVPIPDSLEPKPDDPNNPPGNSRAEKAKAVIDRLEVLKVDPKHHTAMVKKIGSWFGFNTKKQLKINELETIYSFLYQVKMKVEKEQDIFNSLWNEVIKGNELI